jgi:arylformamidase
MAVLDWVDVSMTLRSGMQPCPHGIEYLARRVSDVAKHDAASVSIVWMGSHTGTHVDAPAHLDSRGLTIESMPLNATVGPALVAELAFDQGGPRALLGVEELERVNPEAGGRLLLKTSGRSIEVTDAAAAWLAARELRALGTESHLVHDAQTSAAKRMLLGAGIWIIEQLDLEHVAPGRYELLCLPLKIAGGDAAPARALLRRM